MDLLDLIMHTDDFLYEQVAANLLLSYVIIFLVIYSESGIILCPFLPGDGFLFSVGVIASSTELNIYLVILLCLIAAILGYINNYHLGRLTGNRLLKKNYKWFTRFYQNTHNFMQEYGSRAVIIGRFFPIVRTFLPFVAGMVGMEYRHFVKHTISGAIFWVLFFTLLGFLVGEIPWVQKNYGLIFLGLVLITLIPIIAAIFGRLLRRLLKS